MTVGQRIAQKRKELGLSQEGLGDKLGVSRQAIYKWESDASLPEVEKLVALSRIFSVPVGWLLGEEELKAEALDLPLFLVDFLVVGNRFFCLIDILAQKRVDRIADCLGDLDPHRNHFIVQLFQLAVKSVTHKFLSFQLPKMDLQQFARISRTGR